MRLLNVHVLEFFSFDGADIPPYVITSHRWAAGEEATMKDVSEKRNRHKTGYAKIEGFAAYIANNIPGVEWMWIDTCCINQDDSREVADPINSMFKWYLDAHLWQRISEMSGMSMMHKALPKALGSPVDGRYRSFLHPGALRTSYPFLLDLPSLELSISPVTGIPKEVLHDYRQSESVSVCDKLAWMAGRETTRSEDTRYCLLGIFNTTIADFALAVFPAVVEIVELYRDALTGREIRILVGSLNNQRQIFTDVLEDMLRSILSEAKLQELLQNPHCDAWRADTLDNNIRRRLGPHADIVFSHIARICKTIVKLQEKLPTASIAATDRAMAARAKLVMKSFVRGPQYKASLEGLRVRIEELRGLTEGLKAPGPRNAPEEWLPYLDLVRECAQCLHDELQYRWKCECNDPHPANLQLDIWPVLEGRSDNIVLKFSFLFASDAKFAQPSHWMTAEIAVSAKESSNSSVGLATTGLEGTSQNILKRSLTDMRLAFVASSVPPLTNVGALATSSSVPASSQSSHGVASDGVASDVVDDLCPVVNGPADATHQRRRRLGFVSGSNGYDFNLFIRPDEVAATQTAASITLAECFHKQIRLSLEDRVQVASMLAWAVLQISTTSWLKGNWTKENVLLVLDGANKPSLYLSHAFQSIRRGSPSSTLRPIMSEQVNWVHNASLFAFGVLLLEVCYNRSIEDLAAANEKDEKGEPCGYTPFLTAMRLCKNVKDEMGPHYARAVDACLNLPCTELDVEGKIRDPSGFAKSIMQDIIEPLGIVACNFGY